MTATEAFATSASIKQGSSSSTTTDAGVRRPCDESHDRLSRWSKRWSENQLGWHKTNVHESLLDYGHLIIPDLDKEVCEDTIMTNKSNSIDNDDNDSFRVLVPLCGKTVDMAFLAKQPHVSQVVGVDGIRKALDEFAAEHDELEIVSSSTNGKYERLEGNNIALLKGDFFELDETATNGRFDAVWDRASIVAIQPDMREAYVNTMGNLIKPGGKLLVSTFERRTGTPEAISAGPPFSVAEKEIRSLYEGQDWVESVKILQEVDEFENNPDRKERYLSQGVTSFYELLFEINAKK